MKKYNVDNLEQLAQLCDQRSALCATAHARAPGSTPTPVTAPAAFAAGCATAWIEAATMLRQTGYGANHKLFAVLVDEKAYWVVSTPAEMEGWRRTIPPGYEVRIEGFGLSGLDEINHNHWC